MKIVVQLKKSLNKINKPSHLQDFLHQYCDLVVLEDGMAEKVFSFDLENIFPETFIKLLKEKQYLKYINGLENFYMREGKPNFTTSIGFNIVLSNDEMSFPFIKSIEALGFYSAWLGIEKNIEFNLLIEELKDKGLNCLPFSTIKEEFEKSHFENEFQFLFEKGVVKYGFYHLLNNAFEDHGKEPYADNLLCFLSGSKKINEESYYLYCCDKDENYVFLERKDLIYFIVNHENEIFSNFEKIYQEKIKNADNVSSLNELLLNKKLLKYVSDVFFEVFGQIYIWDKNNLVQELYNNIEYRMEEKNEVNLIKKMLYLLEKDFKNPMFEYEVLTDLSSRSYFKFNHIFNEVLTVINKEDKKINFIEKLFKSVLMKESDETNKKEFQNQFNHFKEFRKTGFVELNKELLLKMKDELKELTLNSYERKVYKKISKMRF